MMVRPETLKSRRRAAGATPVLPDVITLSHYRRAGMTLIEATIAAFVLGLVLFVAAEGTNYIRDQLKTTQTWELLKTLNTGLTAYHAATGEWPEEDATPKQADAQIERQRIREGARGENEGTRAAGRVAAALRRVPASREIMVRAIVKGAEGHADAILHDAWGRPLRCLTRRSSSSVDRQAVAANGGRPIFISAGPEDWPSSDDALNIGLRSDELPR